MDKQRITTSPGQFVPRDHMLVPEVNNEEERTSMWMTSQNQAWDDRLDIELLVVNRHMKEILSAVNNRKRNGSYGPRYRFLLYGGLEIGLDTSLRNLLSISSC